MIASKEHNTIITNEKGNGKILNFDHLTFWVANAKMASSYFVTRFGFKPLAVRECSGIQSTASYAVKLNKITIIFESPCTANGAISRDLALHGDFLKDVAFEVQDLDSLFSQARKEGATIVKDITEGMDNDGVVRYAILKTYGDNTHTLVDRTKYRGLLFPGFVPSEDDPINNVL